MTWRPASSAIKFVLLILPLLTIAVAVWLWLMLAESATSEGYGPYTFLYGVALFLSLMLAGLLGYVAWGASTISYKLDTGNLIIGYGGTRHIIPLTSVTDVYAPGEKVGSATDLAGSPVQVHWRGMTDTIPGYLIGSGDSSQLGRVVTISTAPAGSQVYVATEGLAFGISPRRSLAFIEDLRSKVKAAKEQKGGTHVEQQVPHTKVNGWLVWGSGLWGDKLARWLLLIGLGLCVLFFGWMSMIYGDLPIILPLHWSAQAQIDRVGDLQELLRLPAIALGIWFVNTLLAGLVRRRERAATIFLLASTVAVPVVFAAGALSIILRSV
ncbi:MAG: PH domain-containing protein [Chloroflexia bacterium]